MWTALVLFVVSTAWATDRTDKPRHPTKPKAVQDSATAKPDKGRPTARGTKAAPRAKANANAAKRDRSDPLAAVRAVRHRFLQAMNRGDRQAAVSLWATDGDVANQAGELIRGRKAITRQLDVLFSTADRPKLVLDTVSLRLLTPRVALEDGLARHMPVPEGPPRKTLYSIIYVKQRDGWRLAGIRQAVSYPPGNYAKLAELEWIVGRWRAVHKDEDHQVFEGRFFWSPNKNFILHRFSLHLNNQHVLHGTERIGWDPREQKLKSWIFECDGGVLEGTWTRKGDRWVVEMEGALGDGTPVTGRHEMIRTGEHTMRVSLTERTRDDVPEVEQPPIELERID
jgi:uncharacterized protein (TIGR02246 family)